MKRHLVTGAITLAVGLILAATTWNFAMTQGAVKEVPHERVHEKIDTKIDKVQETVDSIKDLIIDLHTKGD